jgi:DNA-binding MarR family transcriptional regulator
MRKKKAEKEIFINKGRLRKEILSSLDKPQTATELAKMLHRHRSSVSRTLLSLEKEKLVRCLNPNDDKFRYYVSAVQKYKNISIPIQMIREAGLDEKEELKIEVRKGEIKLKKKKS